jgi:hypothetical protein
MGYIRRGLAAIVNVLLPEYLYSFLVFRNLDEETRIADEQLEGVMGLR